MKSGWNSEFLSRSDLETLGFALLGEDVLIHKSVVIVDCSKVALGSHIRIDPFVVISTRGGAEFDNYVHLGSHTVVAGHASVQFGDFVNISHHVGIYTSNEDISGHTLSHPMVPAIQPGRRTAFIPFARHAGVGEHNSGGCQVFRRLNPRSDVADEPPTEALDHL